MMNRAFFLFSAFLALLLLASCGGEQKSEVELPIKDTIPEHIPRIEFGFLLDTFQVEDKKVEAGMTLSHLLLPYGISQVEINQAAQLAKDSAGLNYITEGNRYLVLQSRDTSHKTLYCVYEKSRIDYMIFDFRDSLSVKKVQREVKVVEKEVQGIIKKNSSLFVTLQEVTESQNVSGELAEYVASVFAWTIDFFKIYPGDRFKIIYEEKLVEGEPYGIGDIKAVYFYNINQEYYAFRFQQGDEIGYFDEKGKGMKRPFLKAPLKFSRVSSGYTNRRFHPVQKVWKAHLGTDYAAPTGTPIMATADGTIEAAGYTGGNGNYVKLYHSKTYQTAYLHMSKIASGMRKGIKVKQGDIIGYVGSTGLATGPHVCYRFWKNGKQVNPRAEKFHSSEPIKEENKAAFDAAMQPMKERLDKLVFDEDEIARAK